jgi:hypothetical protein
MAFRRTSKFPRDVALLEHALQSPIDPPQHGRESFIVLEVTEDDEIGPDFIQFSDPDDCSHEDILLSLCKAMIRYIIR